MRRCLGFEALAESTYPGLESISSSTSRSSVKSLVFDQAASLWSRYVRYCRTNHPLTLSVEESMSKTACACPTLLNFKGSGLRFKDSAFGVGIIGSVICMHLQSGVHFHLCCESQQDTTSKYTHHYPPKRPKHPYALYTPPNASYNAPHYIRIQKPQGRKT